MNRDIDVILARLRDEVESGRACQERVNLAYRGRAYSPDDVVSAVSRHIARFRRNMTIGADWKAVESIERVGVAESGAVMFEPHDVTCGRLIWTGTQRGSFWELYSSRMNEIVEMRYSVRRL